MTGFIVANSLGDQLTTALQHTGIGMGTVFVVLIIMIAVISLFKFIPNPELKKKAAAPAAPVVTAPVVEEEAEEEDDLALIAVITAAVAASMGTTSTDGFVVRSVKRAKSSNWKKA